MSLAHLAILAVVVCGVSTFSLDRSAFLNRADISVSEDCSAKLSEIVFGGPQSVTVTCRGHANTEDPHLPSTNNLTTAVETALLRLPQLFGGQQVDFTVNVDGYTTTSNPAQDFVWNSTVLEKQLKPSKIVAIRFNKINVHLGNEATEGCNSLPKTLTVTSQGKVNFFVDRVKLPDNDYDQSTAAAAAIAVLNMEKQELLMDIQTLNASALAATAAFDGEKQELLMDIQTLKASALAATAAFDGEKQELLMDIQTLKASALAATAAFDGEKQELLMDIQTLKASALAATAAFDGEKQELLMDVQTLNASALAATAAFDGEKQELLMDIQTLKASALAATATFNGEKQKLLMEIQTLKARAEAALQTVEVQGWKAVMYNNFGYIPLQPQSSSGADCLAQCNAVTGCRLVSYNRNTRACEGFAAGATPQLVRDVGHTLLAVSTKTFISHIDIDFRGDDAPMHGTFGSGRAFIYLGPGGRETCRLLCSVHPRCNVASYSYNLNECYVKTKYTLNPIHTSNYISFSS